MKNFYYERNYRVKPDEDVYLDVKSVSDGNSSATTVDMPGKPPKKIINNDKVYLGKGADLYDKEIIVTTTVTNLINPVTKIKIDYTISNQETFHHINEKNGDDDAEIQLILTFTKPD